MPNSSGNHRQRDRILSRRRDLSDENVLVFGAAVRLLTGGGPDKIFRKMQIMYCFFAPAVLS